MSKGKKERIASQPDGMPQGRHLSGFKGMKVEGTCFCGSCNPARRPYVRVIDPNKKKGARV